MFLGLTGYRMRAADCLAAGVCDAYMPSNRLDAFIDELRHSDDCTHASVDAIVADFAETPPGDITLAPHRTTIDRIFAADSVEAIIAGLTAEDSDWARDMLSTLATKSPTSLKVTYRLIREGAAMERFQDHMALEYRLACNMFAGVDLFEGVRALIVDKDNKPAWQPATLAGVSDADVAAFFAPVAQGPDFG
jgi:enoyl-CoA hydratase